MRKNYFAKLAIYMKNVYHIDRGLDKLSDGRVNQSAISVRFVSSIPKVPHFVSIRPPHPRLGKGVPSLRKRCWCGLGDFQGRVNLTNYT